MLKILVLLNLMGVLGYSYQGFDYVTKSSELMGFRTTDLDVMINNASSADQTNGKNSVINSSRNKDELQSFFGRLNFEFSEKYLFTGTLRVDGSTKFGGDNKYGYFPSFAFKWRIIEEDFLPSEGALSDLNLRLGYGINRQSRNPS